MTNSNEKMSMEDWNGETRDLSELKVAIVHYWLVGMRGGERVVESLCRIFPNAELITHVVDESQLSEILRERPIHTTFINRLPWAKKLYQSYLPFMPLALEELDLSGYDLVISSESGPAKGVIVPPGVPHICYCHSPMRYLWDHYHIYKSGAGRLTRMLMPWLTHKLRMWDVTSSARVDLVIANSNHVAKRVEKYWRRKAVVVHPPVAVDDFSPVPVEELQDYYLWAGELVSYKRPDLVVEAFNESGKKLVIIGGPDKTVDKLKEVAKDNIVFLGKVPFETLKHYMASCKALIFPGEEDFGIVPVEVMASGRPVIAYGKGGALDTVVEGVTGLFFYEQTVEALNAVVDKLEGLSSPEMEALRKNAIKHANSFREEEFHNNFLRHLDPLLVHVNDAGRNYKHD